MPFYIVSIILVLAIISIILIVAKFIKGKMNKKIKISTGIKF